jgi:uncharacterized protein involved in exopolysaccharide biosynthesis
MHSQQNFDGLEASHLREHYEDIVVRTLGSIAQRIHIVIAVVVFALAVATVLFWQLPRKYSAEVLLQPDLFLSEESAQNAAPQASVDGNSIVKGETRFISSPVMVRAVVNRLGLDRDPEFAAPGLLEKLPNASEVSPLERAARRVWKRLEVTNDPRTYLVSISFTASTPEKAASVANTFALEYLRAKATQRLVDTLTATNIALAHQSANYGEKHPAIVQLKEKREAIRSRLETVASSPTVSLRNFVRSGSVNLTDPNPTPSSPDGLQILGLTLALAVVFSTWLVIWLDRRAGTKHHRPTAPLVHTGGV